MDQKVYLYTLAIKSTNYVDLSKRKITQTEVSLAILNVEVLARNYQSWIAKKFPHHSPVFEWLVRKGLNRSILTAT
jgi:hypothetical protein